MAALSELTYNISVKRAFTARLNRSSALAEKPLVGDGPQTTEYKRRILLTNGNAAIDGADQLYAGVISLAGAGTLTLDLTSFTDIVGRLAQSMARVKSFYAILLNSSQDSSIGTACSGVTIGNAATNAIQLWHSADAHTTPSTNGGETYHSNPTATGWVVDGTNKNILFTNLDATVTAKLYVEIVGGTT